MSAQHTPGLPAEPLYQRIENGIWQDISKDEYDGVSRLWRRAIHPAWPAEFVEAGYIALDGYFIRAKGRDDRGHKVYVLVTSALGSPKPKETDGWAWRDINGDMQVNWTQRPFCECWPISMGKKLPEVELQPGSARFDGAEAWDFATSRAHPLADAEILDLAEKHLTPDFGDVLAFARAILALQSGSKS